VIDLINSNYVPIRVDNDVRPDINTRYNAGGWPTTAFLTPDGDILTGATYVPPDQMADLLIKVAAYYQDNKHELVARIQEGRRRAATSQTTGAGRLDEGLVDRVLGHVEASYDREFGGFGDAPKFPQTDAIALLAEQSVLRREPHLMEMARHTLDRMAAGGTYDHVEGGFFRYSTTRDWSVPHFEKMLEDHAGLLSGLALTGQAAILDDAVRYLETVLRDPGTGLYAGSQDADEAYYALDAEARAKLTAPYVDRRVYVSWNCALAVAYLEADTRLGRPELRESALGVLERVFTAYSGADGGLMRTDGVGGQLGDQVWGVLAASRAGMDERARRLLDHIETVYGDPDGGGYFDHAGTDGLGRLGERVKPLPENSVMAIALHELGETGRARAALASVAGSAKRHGAMAAIFARALDRVRREPVKVTTTSEELARAAVAVHPYVAVERAGDERAVVCVGTVCHAPATTTEAVAEALAVP
jgi:uncharacterized protein YyaL (SSP411 family)